MNNIVRKSFLFQQSTQILDISESMTDTLYGIQRKQYGAVRKVRKANYNILLTYELKRFHEAFNIQLSNNLFFLTNEMEHKRIDNCICCYYLRNFFSTANFA